jgi:hypothetical protein
MFSFEGDFRAKKSINLGGRKTSSGARDELVKKTHSERTLREAERKRQRSATVIQVKTRL